MLINSNPQLKAQSRAVEKKTVKNCFSGNIVKVHGNLIFSSHTDTGLAVNKKAQFFFSLSILDADYDFHFSDCGSRRDIGHSPVNISPSHKALVVIN